MKKSSPLEILKRQIEILSLVEEFPSQFSKHDLCAKFNIELATVNRDLHSLRAQGFPLYSVKKKLVLEKALTNSEYTKLLSMYLPISHDAVAYPKNLSLTTKKMGKRSLATFVSLVKAIEEKREIEIEYYKLYDKVIVPRRLQPYVLFPHTREWMLIAKSGTMFKHFYVDNILRLKLLDGKFVRDKNFDAQKMYLNSWDIFQSTEPTTVKLLFSKQVATLIKSKVWSETQTLDEQNDGSVLLTVRVSSPEEEMLGWIMSWGGDVEILAPMELKKMVKERAKQILQSI